MNDKFQTQVLSITVSQSVTQVWGTSIPHHSKVQKKNRWTIALWTPPPLRCHRADIAATSYARRQRLWANGRKATATQTQQQIAHGGVDVAGDPRPRSRDKETSADQSVWDSIRQSGRELHVKVSYWMDAMEQRLCVILPGTLAKLFQTPSHFHTLSFI